MNKTLLILGASVYQIPAIKTAKRMGYQVIVTDGVSSSPGFALADRCFNIDTTDINGVYTLAEVQNISGIMAPATEAALMTAAYVSERLGLPGPSVAAVEMVTHKQRFRALQTQLGLITPRIFPITKKEFPDHLFDGRKWLIKPNCASGSKGVFVVYRADEFRSYIGQSEKFSRDGKVFLEEYIEGTQHTCEGIIENGLVALYLITDRDTAPLPHTVTTGHRFPSCLPETVQYKSLKFIENILSHLNIKDGPFDCDFIVSHKNEVVLLEMTFRLGGNSLSYLFQAALGFDLLSYAVSYACGDIYEPLKPHSYHSAAVIILGVDRYGQLMWNEAEAEALREEKWVDRLIFDVPRRFQVKPFINSSYRVGEALIKGDSYDDIGRKLTEFKYRLALSIV